jgi:hypothetical protein
MNPKSLFQKITELENQYLAKRDRQDIPVGKIVVASLASALTGGLVVAAFGFHYITSQVTPLIPSQTPAYTQEAALENILVPQPTEEALSEAFVVIMPPEIPQETPTQPPLVITQEPAHPTPEPTPDYRTFELRPHYTKNAGTGVFANAIYSDGMHPLVEADLWRLNRHNIQRIRLEEQPSGCAISDYDSNLLWVGSAVAADVLVNGVSIGRIQPTGCHGYLVEYQVRKGDNVCISNYTPSGFHIIFGNDIDIIYHYDSYIHKVGCR